MSAIGTLLGSGHKEFAALMAVSSYPLLIVPQLQIWSSPTRSDREWYGDWYGNGVRIHRDGFALVPRFFVTLDWVAWTLIA